MEEQLTATEEQSNSQSWSTSVELQGLMSPSILPMTTY